MPNPYTSPTLLDTYFPGKSVLDLMAPFVAYESVSGVDADIDFFRGIIVTAVGDVQIKGVDGNVETIPNVAVGMYPWAGVRIGAATTASVIVGR